MSLSPEQQFLRDLTKLSKKYDLYIGGCGCCGSPFLEGKGADLDGLEFNSEARRYEAKDSDTGKIIK